MNIQTINLLNPDSGKKLVQSLKETGFAVITNHDIDSDILNGAYSEWKDFFASEDKFKFQFNDQSGYFPFRSENAKGSSVKDLKEFFHLFNPFVKIPSNDEFDYVGTMSVAYQLMFLGYELLGMLDNELPVEVTSKFSQRLRNMAEGAPGTLFRVLHYPPLNGDAEPGAVRAAAHEDINLITLLPAATQPGLEVKDSEGNWHAVECDPGSIVINAGDMLQEATGGYLKSTTHRVVNPTDGSEKNSRYSMPLFIHPHGTVRLSDKYTAQEYLDERLREIGLK